MERNWNPADTEHLWLSFGICLLVLTVLSYSTELDREINEFTGKLSDVLVFY